MFPPFPCLSILAVPVLYIGFLQLCPAPAFGAATAVSAALRGSSSFSCVCWSFTFGVGVVWSQVCGPSCDSWVWDSSDARLRRPDALASGRTISFVTVVLFLVSLFGLGLMGRVVPRFLPSFGGAPFPCPGFRLATLAVGWSRHLLFSWALPWFFPSRFRCWLLA